MAMTSVQAPLFTILENHARPPVIGQEHDYPQHTRQTLVGHPVKDSTMSCSEEPGGGDRPPSEKPPLPPKPSTVEVCIKTFLINLGIQANLKQSATTKLKLFLVLTFLELEIVPRYIS